MYDGCSHCQHRQARLLARLCVSPRTVVVGERPTTAGLEKHARRFGRAFVAETAAELGIAVTLAPPEPRRRTRGPSLKQRVARLLAGGHDVEAIAEVENLTPSRARRLVEELS